MSCLHFCKICIQRKLYTKCTSVRKQLKLLLYTYPPSFSKHQYIKLASVQLSGAFQPPKFASKVSYQETVLWYSKILIHMVDNKFLFTSLCTQTHTQMRLYLNYILKHWQKVVSSIDSHPTPPLSFPFHSFFSSNSTTTLSKKKSHTPEEERERERELSYNDDDDDDDLGLWWKSSRPSLFVTEHLDKEYSWEEREGEGRGGGSAYYIAGVNIKWCVFGI